MVRERATLHAITVTVRGRRRRRDDRGRRAAIQAGGAQPALQRRQVHPRRRQRVRPRLPRGDRPRGHRDRHRHRGARRGPGTDLRVLPAGPPGSTEGGGHRPRTDAVPTHRRAVRRADVAGEHPGCRKHVRLLDPGRCRSSGRGRLAWARRASASSFSSTTTGRRWTSSRPTWTVRRPGCCGPGTASRPSSWSARCCPPPSCSTSGCHGSTAGRCWPSSRRTPPPPISQWSSPRSSTIGPAGLALGADAYLRKPVRREELVDALRRVGVLVDQSRDSPHRSRHDAAPDPRGRGQSAEPQAGSRRAPVRRLRRHRGAVRRGGSARRPSRIRRIWC